MVLVRVVDLLPHHTHHTHHRVTDLNWMVMWIGCFSAASCRALRTVSVLPDRLMPSVPDSHWPP